ncbi:hypothetical protein GGR58DRAFT_287609 [Xylaria digitata]|nr:hypothetical protein GGR58DRAFT_287609 [Xylaria digitata]
MPPAPVILADLGKLSKLPLELLFMVIEYFDIRSAARFTQVNRQAQFLLWSDKDYLLLRHSLFRDLSEYKRKSESHKFSRLTSLALLQDANYHTLAHTISIPICLMCRHVQSTPVMRLDVHTGHAVCFECSPSDVASILIFAGCVQIHREILKNRTLYRLPKGQLIRMFAVFGCLQ